MNSILPQLRRGLGLRFFVAAVAAMGLCFVSFLQPLLLALRQGGRFYQGYHNELITQAFSSDGLASFLPVLAAIPLSAGYLEDVKSKFARFYLIRGSYHSYLFSHCVACWLCGGGAVALGCGTAWGLTTLLLTPMEQVMENYGSITPKIAAQLTLLMLNGGLWAMVGMALSTVMESSYIAYVSPFIVYYLLVILCQRYFPDAWPLYPRNWLDSEIWPYGVSSAWWFLLELTALTGLLFFQRGKRRLESL